MIATGLQQGRAIEYAHTVSPAMTQVERARLFGVSERTARRYETILRELADRIEALFEDWTAPLPRLDRTKTIYEIAKESILGILIAVRTSLGLIFKASYNDSLRSPEDLVILERDLKVVPKNLLSDDKESLGDSYRPPAEKQHLCIRHVCPQEPTAGWVHVSKDIGYCLHCGATFTEIFKQVGTADATICAQKY